MPASFLVFEAATPAGTRAFSAPLIVKGWGAIVASVCR